MPWICLSDWARLFPTQASALNELAKGVLYPIVKLYKQPYRTPETGLKKAQQFAYCGIDVSPQEVIHVTHMTFGPPPRLLPPTRANLKALLPMLEGIHVAAAMKDRHDIRENSWTVRTVLIDAQLSPGRRKKK